MTADRHKLDAAMCRAVPKSKSLQVASTSAERHHVHQRVFSSLRRDDGFKKQTGLRETRARSNAAKLTPVTHEKTGGRYMTRFRTMRAASAYEKYDPGWKLEVSHTRATSTRKHSLALPQRGDRAVSEQKDLLVLALPRHKLTTPAEGTLSPPGREACSTTWISCGTSK